MGYQPDPLHSCRAKIARAREHLGALKVPVDSVLLDGKTYSVVKEPNAKPGVHALRLQPHRSLPLVARALLIGDCIHNMRSALDHLFWALILRKHPSGKIKKATTANFPIVKDPATFNGRKADLEEWLGKDVAAMIERMQPYQGPGPAKNALFFIHQRDITDKHRLLLPMVMMAEHGQFGFKRGSSHPSPNIHTEIHAAALENNAVLATITVTPPDAVMDVEFNPTLAIVFETDPIAHIVLPTLRGLLEVVESVVADFQPLFPAAHGS